MSELKEHLFVPYSELQQGDELTDAITIAKSYYLKSEADKVIAEKDAKILALDAEVFKQKHHAKLFFDERNYAETQLRHQKRKRCLAMKQWCYDRWIRAYHSNEFEKTRFYVRWQKRWEELAKEPTWEKFLQLICGEGE